MPGNPKLKLWTDSIKEYCNKKKCTYKVPTKGTADYDAVRKIYLKKCGNK